jgi:hypothetical protein
MAEKKPADTGSQPPETGIPPEQIRMLQENMATSAVDFLSAGPLERFGDVERLLLKTETKKTLITETQLLDLSPNLINWDWSTLQWPMETDVSVFKGIRHTVDRNRMLLDIPVGHESEWAPNQLFLGLLDQETRVAESGKEIERASRTFMQFYFDSMLNMDPKNRQMELGMEHLGIFYNLTHSFTADLSKLAQEHPTEAEGIKKEFLLADERGETMMHRMSKYAAVIDHTHRVLEKMNTFNPLLGHEKVLPEAAEDLMAGLFRRIPRKTERGQEQLGSEETSRVSIFLGANGEQLSQDAAGNVYLKDGSLAKKKKDGSFEGAAKVDFYINTLDFFNKLRSVREKRWLVSVFCALAVENAKEGIDKFTGDIAQDRGPRDELFKRIQGRAQRYFDNFDGGLVGRELMDFNLAKTAFGLIFAQSCQTFEVGRWSLASDWSKKEEETGGKKTGRFIWVAAPPEFGNPTMAGDFPVALNFFYHELLYGLKNRISSANNGILSIVNIERAEEVAKALLSKTERERQIRALFEKIKADTTHKYDYLITSLGFIGVFRHVFADSLPNGDPNKYSGIYRGVWEKANRDAATKDPTGKLAGNWGEEMNQQVIEFFEKKVIFMPTWIPHSSAPGADPNDSYVFPLILPNLEVSSYDLMSVSKSTKLTTNGRENKTPEDIISIGDLLNGTWTGSVETGFERKSWKEGGRFLTLNEVAPLFYELHPHQDDSIEVDRKFSLQGISASYGTFSEDLKKMASENVLAFIDLLFKDWDLGTRNQTDEDGEFKRPTREIVYMTYAVYMNLALNVHNLLGRGGKNRFTVDWMKQKGTSEKEASRPSNFQSTLHAMHTLVSSKLGYPNYDSSARRLFIGLNKAVEGIYARADEVSSATAQKIDNKLGSPQGR